MKAEPTHTAVPLFDDEQWRSELATATRPDGRIYRAIKGPIAVVVEDHNDNEAIIVLRTHDVDRAYQLAQRLAPSTGGQIWHDKSFRTWLCDTYRYGQRTYDVDSSRGCPAVWFEVC